MDSRADDLLVPASDLVAPGRVAEFRRGLREATPVVMGTLPYALVLGAQASQKGLSPVEMPLMAGLNFAGGSEFAAIELWTSPPHLLLIATITLLINSRHILMGAALTPFLQHLPKRQALAALFVMCDETWALGLADARRRATAGHRHGFSLPYYFGTGAALYVVWVAFTTLGALVGPTLGNVRDYGFDMAFPAVFLVLIAGMWQGVRAARPWLVSLIVAAVTYLLVPGAWYVAAGALTGMAAAWIWAKPE
jgi:4-azaleucine resistance transporter AzlC